MTREELEAEIVARAQKDPAFLEALRKDPKGALDAELKKLHPGLKLPATTKVSVVEETPDHIYLHIPLPKEGALSDEELVGVSGGVGANPAVNTALASNPSVSAVDAISFTIATVVVT